MIKNLFDTLIEYLLDLITLGFDIIISACQNIFSIDLTLFESVFSGTKVLYMAVLGAAIGLVVLLFILNILKCFGPNAKEAENPFELLARAFFALFLVMFARPILGYLLAYGNSHFVVLQKIGTKAGNTTKLASHTYDAIVKSFSSDSAIVRAFQNESGYGLVIRIIAFIFSIFVVYTFCKLCTTAIKNYVILGVFSSLITLPAACYASKSTEDILKNFIKVLVGQIVMLYIGLWFLKVGSAAVTNIHAPVISDVTNSVKGVTTFGNFFGSGGKLMAAKAIKTSAKFTSVSSAIIWSLMIGYFFQIGIQVNSYVKELGIGISGKFGRSFLGSAANLALRGVQMTRYMGGGHKANSDSGGVKPENAPSPGDSLAQNGGNYPTDEGETESTSKAQQGKSDDFGAGTKHGKMAGVQAKGYASDKNSQPGLSDGFGANTKSGQRYADRAAKNDVFSQGKGAVQAGIRKAAQQKLSGEEARDAVMGAMGMKGNASPMEGLDNGIQFSTGDNQPASHFTDICTDGSGGITGKFNDEAVEMMTEDRFQELAHGEGAIKSDDFQKIDFGGENMYVNKAAAPQFANIFQPMYDMNVGGYQIKHGKTDSGYQVDVSSDNLHVKFNLE